MGAEGRFTVGLIGARGYVGAELIALLSQHPSFDIHVVSSRKLAGKAVVDTVAGAPAGLKYTRLEPTDVADNPCDLWVLALPNGLSRLWVEAIDAAIAAGQAGQDTAIVDLSTDHRFDNTWSYGLPEIRRKHILNARRIANPGCYATGAQLGLYPVLDLLAGPAHVFGISGYSGAGTAPSPKNDPAVLKDNLIPYALTGHAHEREIRWQLGHQVHFMPHVAPFFRGITLTISFVLKEPVSLELLEARYRNAYRHEPLVRFGQEIPLVRDAGGKHGVQIGGLAVEATAGHAVIVVTLDNLLKGAATQGLQNMNLVCGLDELAGLRAML